MQRHFFDAPLDERRIRDERPLLIRNSRGAFRLAENNRWNEIPEYLASHTSYAFNLLSGQNPKEVQAPYDVGDLSRCLLVLEYFMANPHRLPMNILMERFDYLSKSCRTWEAIIANYQYLMQLFLDNTPAAEMNRRVNKLIDHHIAQDISPEDFNRAQELLFTQYQGPVTLTGNQMNAYLMLARAQGLGISICYSQPRVRVSGACNTEAQVKDPKVHAHANVDWECNISFNQKTLRLLSLFKQSPVEAAATRNNNLEESPHL